MSSEPVAYLDTNAVIRLIDARPGSISKTAQECIEAHRLFISPMVIFELQLLNEIGRFRMTAQDAIWHLLARIDLSVCDLRMLTVAEQTLPLTWTRDPGDRWITAQAIARDNAPLITSDRNIIAHYQQAVW